MAIGPSRSLEAACRVESRCEVCQCREVEDYGDWSEEHGEGGEAGSELSSGREPEELEVCFPTMSPKSSVTGVVKNIK